MTGGTNHLGMPDCPVMLTSDGDTLLVTFADVPEALTFGADEEAVLLHPADAPETALTFYVATGKPLTEPSVSELGQKTVTFGSGRAWSRF